MMIMMHDAQNISIAFQLKNEGMNKRTYVCDKCAFSIFPVKIMNRNVI